MDLTAFMLWVVDMAMVEASGGNKWTGSSGSVWWVGRAGDGTFELGKVW